MSSPADEIFPKCLECDSFMIKLMKKDEAGKMHHKFLCELCGTQTEAVAGDVKITKENGSDEAEYHIYTKEGQQAGGSSGSGGPEPKSHPGPARALFPGNVDSKIDEVEDRLKDFLNQFREERASTMMG